MSKQSILEQIHQRARAEFSDEEIGQVQHRAQDRNTPDRVSRELFEADDPAPRRRRCAWPAGGAVHQASRDPQPGAIHGVGDVGADLAPKFFADFVEAREIFGGHALPEPVLHGFVAADRHEREAARRDRRRRDEAFTGCDRAFDRARILDGCRTAPGGRESAKQARDSFAPDRHRRNDFDPEPGGESFRPDRNPTFGRFVHHVETKDERKFHLRELDGEQERPLEVLRVSNENDTAVSFGEQDVARHPLVLRRRKKRCDSGRSVTGVRSPSSTAEPVVTSTVVPG